MSVYEYLSAPLQGERNFVTEQRGRFTLRRNAIHEAAAVGAIVERKLLQADRERRTKAIEWSLA